MRLTKKSFIPTKRPFSVISTRRSTWRNLSTTLKMTICRLIRKLYELRIIS
ncbi:MAG: hypothetical protein ACI3Y9_10530 [Candidatus Cryptobacteroides sp.]